MDFVQTIIHQEFKVNLGQKLLYSNFHAWKKTNTIHTKKARCKIFTNSYKNINMNKLISSTFLYCPPMYPMFFQQMEKKAAKRRKWVLNISGKEGLLHVTVSFTSIISPTLPLCLVSIHAIREWEINCYKGNYRQKVKK